MVTLGGWAFSYERGTPVQAYMRVRGKGGLRVSEAALVLWREEEERCRSRANMAHIRQSRPDYGLGFPQTVWRTCT